MQSVYRTHPVRAGMVERVEDYRWSSFGLRFITNAQDDWLDVHSCYEAPAADGELRLIRDAVQRGQLTGGRQFTDEVEQVLGRRVEYRGRGRPQGVLGT